MMLFKQRKPRPFHHSFLYIDERKELLKQIEQRSIAELQREEKANVKSYKDDDREGRLESFRSESNNPYQFDFHSSRLKYRTRTHLFIMLCIAIALILLCGVFFISITS